MSDSEKQRMYEVVERVVLKLAHEYRLDTAETTEFAKYVATRWEEKYGTG